MDSITQEVISRTADTFSVQVGAVRFLNDFTEKQCPGVVNTAPATAAALQSLAYYLAHHYAAILPEFNIQEFYIRCGFMVSSGYPYIIDPK